MLLTREMFSYRYESEGHDGRPARQFRRPCLPAAFHAAPVEFGLDRRFLEIFDMEG